MCWLGGHATAIVVAAAADGFSRGRLWLVIHLSQLGLELEKFGRCAFAVVAAERSMVARTAVAAAAEKRRMMFADSDRFIGSLDPRGSWQSKRAGRLIVVESAGFDHFEPHIDAYCWHYLRPGNMISRYSFP